MVQEDQATLAVRQLVISLARASLGDHYVKGAIGDYPGANSRLKMEKNDVSNPEDARMFTARSLYNRCSGNQGQAKVKQMPQGDPNNPLHLANPKKYKWIRMVQRNYLNEYYGESCQDVLHFDCIGYVKYCLGKVIPLFKTYGMSIATLRKQLEVIKIGGVDENNLCAADILIRNNNGHIGIAVGENFKFVLQAEIESTGVVQRNLSTWEFHGRVPREFWLGHPLSDWDKVNWDEM